MYCPTVYNSMTDPSVRIAKDYEGKFKSWTADIKKYLSHALCLKDKFEKGSLYLDEMSQVSYSRNLEVTPILWTAIHSPDKPVSLTSP